MERDQKVHTTLNVLCVTTQILGVVYLLGVRMGW